MRFLRVVPRLALLSLFFLFQLSTRAQGHKCNHTDLVWDASRSGVGIPSTCTDLSLVEESIGDVGVAALALKLGGDGGSDDAGSSDTRSELRIETLDLYENHIGDEGARSLSKALANPASTLKELYLWGNAIGNEGAADLAKALEVNTQLEALVMWNNNVGDKGCEALLKALNKNAKVSKLYLTGNKVSSGSGCLKALKTRLSHEEVQKRAQAALDRGVDCAVGAWSNLGWSDCQGACGAQGFQQREREVLIPRSGGGRKCPALEEVRSCVCEACPKDSLFELMQECRLSEPREVVDMVRDNLGAASVQDLFELDAEDFKELKDLKVAQRKRLIRCVCDACEDSAPCCDAHRGQGRHHSSVEDIMKLAEVVRRGDTMATDGSDCDGALGLYGEALAMSKDMRAHNFFGEVSFKIFLVKTRCRGHRTPTREEGEACGEGATGEEGAGIDFLGQEWLFEDFRRGVQHGWSKESHAKAVEHHSEPLTPSSTVEVAVPAIKVKGGGSVAGGGGGEGKRATVKGITSPEGGGDEVDTELEEPMAGLHWSSWYELFDTTSDACNRKDVDRVWSRLMLKYNADQAYRHPWSMECANLASIVVSSGRELLFDMTPCGARKGSSDHEEM